MANSRETIKRRYERNLIIWNSKWEFIQMVCIFWLRILVVFQRTKHSIHSRAQRIYRSNILGKIIETNGNTTANANAQKWQKTNCDDNINESRKNVVKVVKQNQTGNGAMQKCHFWAFVAFFFFLLLWRRFKRAFYYEHFRDHITEQKKNVTVWSTPSSQFSSICILTLCFDSFYGFSNTFNMNNEQWTTIII